MRVVLLTHGGADLVIEKLAALAGVEVAGVFIETEIAPRRGVVEKFRRSIRYDGISATIRKLAVKRTRAADGTESFEKTREAARRHGIAVTEVANFHSSGSINQLTATAADLGVIYGTNIIRPNVYSIPKLGAINLHQGLAPHYRGGPPVFWELFNGEKEIGLSVHFVTEKVDAGDIILQKTVPLVYDASYGLDHESFVDDYRERLRVDCANLVAEAVARIASGVFDRIPQDVSIGRRYRLPTRKEKNELRRRLKVRLSRTANG